MGGGGHAGPHRGKGRGQRDVVRRRLGSPRRGRDDTHRSGIHGHRTRGHVEKGGHGEPAGEGGRSWGAALAQRSVW